MIIKANGKDIEVKNVFSNRIQKEGKSYPALKILFENAILVSEIEALVSGTLEIGETIYEGYTTLGDISVIIGKITTAEQERNIAEAERDVAINTIGILAGNNSLTTEEAIKQRDIIEQVVQSLDDDEALNAITLHPSWESLVERGSVEAEAGYRFYYGTHLYKCINANPTFLANWVPGVGTESLYERIDEKHEGTLEDPIPYDGNMTLYNGKCYIQNDVIYVCTRDTVNPVYNALSELVGLYVEIYTA